MRLCDVRAACRASQRAVITHLTGMQLFDEPLPLKEKETGNYSSHYFVNGVEGCLGSRL